MSVQVGRDEESLTLSEVPVCTAVFPEGAVEVGPVQVDVRGVRVELQGQGEVLQCFWNLPQQGERNGSVEHG